jgi:Beta-carotene isomerase D27-like, C-terminal
MPVVVMIEKETYDDDRLDRLFIWLFSRKMAKALGRGTALKGYDGFVDLSKKIMQGRNAKQQQEVVAKVLSSLVPPPILAMIRTMFSPTQWVCESNAWFAARLFEWLVGPCEVREVEVRGADQQMRTQKSGVHMKKCRYLEQSGCVGMCINMCKLPTQDFFTQGFGIPLTMTPNFEDLSCEMIFGQLPPPLETEAAYQQPCLVEQCGVATSSEPCPKVREF